MDDSVSRYLARGWSVVALHGVVGGVCTCGSTEPDHGAGKHPLYRNWQKIPIRELGIWQHVSARGQPTNLGLATGRASGVFALDFDPKNVIDQAAVFAIINALPQTWAQRTGSGGMHWLFTMPADFEPTNRTGLLPKGLDIRGSGGQIVIAPSVTDKGPYAILRDAEPLPAPAALLDAIRPPAYEPRPASSGEPAGPQLDKRTAAYAATARDAVLADLRNESSTRNEQAYRTACRLHELINAGWLDYDATCDAYLQACEQASGNKPEPFGQAEAHQVWTNAAHRTAAEVATLPPSMMGGTRLDFPAARTGFGITSPDGPTSSPPLSSDLGSVPLFMNPGETPSISSAEPGTSPTGLNLPPEFWSARPVLKHIQLAAHARLVSADVALYSMLARLAALWPHQVKINNGIKNGASANLFVSVVGPSGSGKTSGIGVARGLLSRPPWLDLTDFADDRPLGTGEGIAESYMGTKTVPKLDEHKVPIQDTKGAIKLEKVRGQVLHNALVHADEGEAMAKLLERSGATVAETLRRAWVGETLGQANGSAETTRIIREGRYSLGMIVGFQPETAQPLLNDIAPGTPQRFLWCWAIDPSIPEEDVPDPGPVPGIWPPAQDDGNEWIIGAPSADHRPVTFETAIIDELKPVVRGVSKGTLSLPPLDAHYPLMLVKLSTLLAYLDCGRRNVTESDWELAKIVWRTSRTVQDHLMTYGRELLGKAAADKRSAYAAQEGEAEVAKLAVRDRDDATKVEQGALSIGRWVGRQDAPFTRSRMLQCVAGAYRSRLAQDCVALALERQWVIELDGKFGKGPVHVT